MYEARIGYRNEIKTFSKTVVPIHYGFEKPGGGLGTASSIFPLADSSFS